MRSLLRFTCGTTVLALGVLAHHGGLSAQTPAGGQTPSSSPSAVPAPSHQATSPAPGATSVSIPGVPDRPDLVTVVPFELYHGWVFFTAEVDGRRGRLLLDTGEPVIHLNRRYVKPGNAGALDTATDAVPDGFSINIPFNVHTVHIGTIREQLKATDIGPPTPLYPTNSNIENYFKFNWFEKNGHPLLGLLGISAMEPFETIIDYPNHRLIFIKLDSAGHRLVDVPAFTPTLTTPLAPVSNQTGAHWWGIVARLGDEVDTLEIDTGGPCSNLLGAMREKHTEHLTPAGQCTDLNGEPLLAFDHIVVQGRTFDALPFAVDIDDSNDLNYPFLRQLGVVGFNFRTRQFMAYR